MMNCSNLNKTGIDTGIWGFVLAAEHNHDISVIVSITEYFHPHKNSSPHHVINCIPHCQMSLGKQNVPRQWLGPYLKLCYLIPRQGFPNMNLFFFFFLATTVACCVLVLWLGTEPGHPPVEEQGHLPSSATPCPPSGFLNSPYWKILVF